MSVFTPVNQQQLIVHLQQYDLCNLISLEGIAAGVENSNFFVTTDKGEYVLTLFEAHSIETITFYLGLMVHLSDAGISTIKPIASKQGALLLQLNNKPAVIVKRIKGNNPVEISTTHCSQIGEMLAKFHLAAQNFPQQLHNEFDLAWQQQSVTLFLARLSTEDAKLLESELIFQHQWLDQINKLPSGIIHGDLFRDNTLFINKGNSAKLSAILDLYTACNDALLIDICIVINDWCFDDNGMLNESLAKYVLNAYQMIRPLEKNEKEMFNILLRASALRFWVLRLNLKYNPKATYNESPSNEYNPNEYKQKLLKHIAYEANNMRLLAND